MRYALLAFVVLAIAWLVREAWRFQRFRTQPERARRARRRHLRNASKLVELAEGGTPESPIEVDSPAVIEAHAGRQTCPACGSPLEVENPEVLRHDGERLRRAPVSCRECPWSGAFHYRLREQLLN